MSDTAYNLILCSTPHLDWDWLLPFPILCDDQPSNSIGYFQSGHGPAFKIFDDAIECLGRDPAYTYSICEIGFLRAYVEAYPAKADGLLKAGARLEILGGGITSPDNLLSHGEAFIRNYLIGSDWARSILGISPRQAWLPDDFGHDTQLPVVLAAMGYDGVGFWRIPGSYHGDLKLQDKSKTKKTLYEQMKPSKSGHAEKPCDFIWTARDGSSAVAHWLSGTYSQGSGLYGLDKSAAVGTIGGYIGDNASVSPTSTLFVPVCNDFMLPVDNLVEQVEAFNEAERAASSPRRAKVGTFGEFIESIKASGQLEAQSFQPQPYLMGCYQTRPRIKRLHFAATRTLLSAEVFAVFAGSRSSGASKGGYDVGSWQMEAQGRVPVLRKIWDDLVPSTHHDYITGTAQTYVYRGEQLPRLELAEAGARALRDAAVREIAGNILASPRAADAELAVAVFNPLGFARSGPVSLYPTPDTADLPFNSVRIGADRFPVQRGAEGDWLFVAGAASLGYATVYLSSAQVTQAGPPPTIERTDTSYRLANGSLVAEIDAETGDILSLQDVAAGGRANVLGRANAVVFYVDQKGDNYWYDEETNGQSLSPAGAEIDAGATRATVIERGPVRVRLRCSTTYVVGGSAGFRVTYVREYALVAGEPMLRMRTVGACPYGYSAMVSFDTCEGMTTLAHGTPYHWDDAPAVPYVLCPSMQPTHDFVVPEGADGVPLFAVYHGDMPAWGQVLTEAGAGIEPSRVLLGGLSRNPSGYHFGGVTPLPDTIDPDSHAFDYAIRVPSGISRGSHGAADLGTGCQLTESLGYTAPLLACVVPAPISCALPWTSRTLPEAFSLASVSAGGPSQPIITVAKPAEADPNEVVFRIYQASNAPMDVTLSLAGLGKLNGLTGEQDRGSMTVTPVTALEQPIAGAGPLTVAGIDCTFTAPLALTTLRVTAGG